VEPSTGSVATLTETGFDRAAEVTLAHRMLELYLSEHVGQITEASRGGERLVEQIPPELREELKRRVRLDAMTRQH
ncbi:MAG: hypothetical protein ACE5KM_24850, partial [Planctomycetaceae bacterium]